MKALLLILASLSVLELSAQKNVQQLTPVRLSIFKNGTFFIKKEAVVKIQNGAFYIAAPKNALMGTYWLAAGKEAPIKSIIVTEDTFRVERKAIFISDYLKANVNKEINLQDYSYFSDSAGLKGVLLDYDEETKIAKIRTENNRITVLNVSEYKKLVVTADNPLKSWADSFATVAKINVKAGASSTLSSSFTLERGLQWYPSYWLKIINGKEARLELKATIVTGKESFYNTDIDVVIGSPEMFYGQQLDPVSVGFLHGEIFEPGTYENNVVPQQTGNNGYNAYNWSGNTSSFSVTPSGNVSADNDAEGEKLEDLYFFKLGKIDLPGNSRTIIPVMSTNVQYQDIYTVDIPTTISASDTEGGIDVLHNFRVVNNGEGPYTSGSVLVINDNELPVAQSQLKYTPVKGTTDILLSKAIDVKVKSDEVENKREVSAKKSGTGDFYDKVSYKGTVGVANYQDKKITIKVKKYIQGTPVEASQNGKIKKTVVDDNDSVNATAVIEWEIELAPGQKKDVGYSYTAYKK